MNGCVAEVDPVGSSQDELRAGIKWEAHPKLPWTFREAWGTDSQKYKTDYVHNRGKYAIDITLDACDFGHAENSVYAWTLTQADGTSAPVTVESTHCRASYGRLDEPRCRLASNLVRARDEYENPEEPMPQLAVDSDDPPPTPRPRDWNIDSTFPTALLPAHSDWASFVDAPSRESLPAICYAGESRPAVTVPSAGKYEVRLDVYTQDRQLLGRHRDELEVTDVTVVSLGDSYGSGEGVPDDQKTGWTDKPIATGTWYRAYWDEPCHRSSRSAHSRFAKYLEERDPHSVVTYLSFACAGASLDDGGYVPQDLEDDPDRKHSQIEDAVLAVCEGADECKPVDYTLVSFGGNDVGFNRIAPACAFSYVPWEWNECHDALDKDKPESERRHNIALAALPDNYDHFSSLIESGLRPGQVLHSGYPQYLFAPEGKECDNDELFGDAGKWENAEVGRASAALNRAIQLNSIRHGWSYVDVADEFRGHEYCTSDPLLRAVSSSLFGQGDTDGTLHPNGAGYQVYTNQFKKAYHGARWIPADIMMTFLN